MAQLCEYFLEASVYAVAYFNAFHKPMDLQLILLFTMQLNYFEEVASLRLVRISTLVSCFGIMQENPKVIHFYKDPTENTP